MCLSDPPGRPRKGVFAGAVGEAAPDAAKGPTKASQKSIAAHVPSALIHGYRLVISPWIGPRCRFLPTCSDYALDAIARHGAIRGGWLTLSRLARCHPFGGSGFDPVPTAAGISGRHDVSVGRQARQGQFGHRRQSKV